MNNLVIKCIAIDDEPLALRQLATYIEKTPSLQLIKACTNVLEAMPLVMDGSVDAMFIDINMPDLNGLDFVKSLSSPPLVVFTTAYSEYAMEGFKVDAVDYLLKPFGLDEFHRAAERVRKRYEAINAASVSIIDADDSMFLKTDYKIVRISINDIRYIEAMSEYLRVHFITPGQRPLVVLLSMKKMEEALPSRQFIRVHRSHIINLKEIREVYKNRIMLDGNIDIPIGDSYREQFNTYLNAKFISK